MYKKWKYHEYRIHESTDDYWRLDILNSKGSEGWEVCGVIHERGYYTYTFKRELKDDSQRAD